MGHMGAESTIQDELERLIEYITAKEGRPFDPAPLLKIASANIIAKLTIGER
jgi:hypothetical protein